jgi:tryptophan synthase alpha chain
VSARLTAAFSALNAHNRAGLITYVMGGDPDWQTSFEIVQALIGAGADIIELGFPFSDPMADGPAIQAAGERALKAETSLITVLQLAAEIRRTNATTPIILMGYVNPVEQMGAAAFAEAAAGAGIDGAILVDLPPEEDSDVRTALAQHGLALIRLAAPTTDAMRLQAVLDGAAGFIYHVSVAGVTGQKAAPADAAREAVMRLKAATPLPVAVGFGVRDAASAAALAQTADAVVVGSALVEIIRTQAEAGASGEQIAKAVADAAKTLRAAVETARTADYTENATRIRTGPDAP